MKTIIKQEKDNICELCGGKGYIQEDKGKPVHTCWKCLREGKLNEGNVK